MDAGRLRALAQPLRLRLLELLHTDGPATASQLARQLGVAVQTGGEVARTFSEIESAIK